MRVTYSSNLLGASGISSLDSMHERCQGHGTLHHLLRLPRGDTCFLLAQHIYPYSQSEATSLATRVEAFNRRVLASRRLLHWPRMRLLLLAQGEAVIGNNKGTCSGVARYAQRFVHTGDWEFIYPGR